MNIRILTLITLLSTISISNSFAGGVGGFGIKGGLNASTISIKGESFSDQKKKFRFGAIAGLSYEIATEKSFALDIELQYSLIGNNLKYSVGGKDGSFKTYFHNVNLPISAKFYIGDVFNVYAGGFVGFAVGGHLKNTFDGNLLTDTNLFSKSLQDADDNDMFNRINAGLLFGFEAISKKGIGAGFRFTQGLTSINNTKHAVIADRSVSSEVAVYTVFRIGKK